MSSQRPVSGQAPTPRWVRYVVAFLLLWLVVSIGWFLGALREAKRIKQHQDRPDLISK